MTHVCKSTRDLRPSIFRQIVVVIDIQFQGQPFDVSLFRSEKTCHYTHTFLYKCARWQWNLCSKIPTGSQTFFTFSLSSNFRNFIVFAVYNAAVGTVLRKQNWPSWFFSHHKTSHRYSCYFGETICREFWRNTIYILVFFYRRCCSNNKFAVLGLSTDCTSFVYDDDREPGTDEPIILFKRSAGSNVPAFFWLRNKKTGWNLR